MRLLLKLLTISTGCWLAHLIWVVQPDRKLLDNLESKIEAADFSEVESLLNQFGFASTTWTYFASTQRFSGGVGPSPSLYMGPELKQQFFALCPVKCELTFSIRTDLVPYLSMDRNYKFYTILAGEGSTQVLPDHNFWIMYLP